MISVQEFRAAVAVAMTVALAAPVAAQDDPSLFGIRTASVTYGPYARIEAGVAVPSLDNAYWLPPGTDDPRIDFDADGDNAGFGAVAFGFDWQNGIRADLAFFGTGTSDVVAPCASAGDGQPCSFHSDITDASVSTVGAMANLFYAPFEARGSNAVFQPFFVAGLGIARNEVGEWTRTKNPDNPTFASGTVRTFEGDTTTGLAWSVGVGAALQVTRPGRWPVIVEASWRYYDFGTASGGATPIGTGSEPIQPFTFDRTDQVFTLGVRVPLRRY